MANEVVNGAAHKGGRYGGGLLRGPLLAAPPVDATGELDPLFKAVSLVGDSGLTDNITRDTEDTLDINGDVVFTSQTEYGVEITVTLLERTFEALKMVNGEGNVTQKVDKATGKVTRVIQYNSDELERAQYILQLRSRGRAIRKHYPVAQVTEISEVQYSKSQPIQYECTIKAYKDENEQAQYEFEEFTVSLEDAAAMEDSPAPAGV